MARLVFGLTILLSAAIQCFVAPQARAGDLSCSGLIGGGPTVSPIDGNVTVPDGKSCTLSLVNITGNIGSAPMQSSQYWPTRSRLRSAAISKPRTARGLG